MTTTRRIATVCLVLGLGLGCAMPPEDGFGDDPPPPSILGGWTAEIGQYCGLAAVFKPGNAYEFVKVCSLTGGAIGAQSDAGTFTLTGSGEQRLALTAKTSTCEEPALNGSYGAIVTDSVLTFKASDAVIVFKKASPGGGGNGAAAQYGCFTGGKFVPMAVHPVP